MGQTRNYKTNKIKSKPVTKMFWPLTVDPSCPPMTVENAFGVLSKTSLLKAYVFPNLVSILLSKYFFIVLFI